MLGEESRRTKGRPADAGILHLAPAEVGFDFSSAFLMMPAGLIKCFFIREDVFSKIMCLYLRESELKELDYE